MIRELSSLILSCTAKNGFGNDIWVKHSCRFHSYRAQFCPKKLETRVHVCGEKGKNMFVVLEDGKVTKPHKRT